MRVLPVLVVASATAIFSFSATAAEKHPPKNTDGAKPPVTRLVMPIMSSSRGMQLFIDKKCYVCHSVNGVGGTDAAALDAHDMDEYMNPFDLAAKMWKMATIMIPMQEEELGKQIEFTGDELADIVAFLHDDRQQHLLTRDMLPAN
ncbi:MAG: c-type cytochrome [Paracoccaceae bacterium]|nr:c-type cytochrome [Paracoccaceae bacterium]